MAQKKKLDDIDASKNQEMLDKEAAMQTAIAKIEKSFGVRVFQLKDRAIEKVQVIPTGVLSIDRALRVFGFPRGRVIELYGEPGSGKTMLSLLAIGEVQRSGGKAAFIDMECTYDERFSELLGVNNSQLFYCSPESAEKALDTAVALAESNAFDLIVLDSVANLVPQAELEGDMSDNHVGLLARIMSKGLRKLTNTLSRTHTSMIFINQIRQKIGVMYGNPNTTTGGKALAFYASIRIEVKGGTPIKQGDEPIGHKAEIVVKKNKVGPPFGHGEVSVYYGRGIDIVRDICTVAKEEGVITGTSWLSFISEKYTTPTGSKEFRIQGFDNFVDAMRPLYDTVVKEMRDKVQEKIQKETQTFQSQRDLSTEEQQEAAEAQDELSE